MGEQMGQAGKGTDLWAIDQLSTSLWGLAETVLFQPLSNGKWTADYPHCQVRGQSFEVSAAIRHDRISRPSSAVRGEGATRRCIVLRFRKAGDKPRYWYLNVCSPGARDEMRLTRVFTRRQTRKAFSPVLKGKDAPSLAQYLYVAPDMPQADLKAQLCLYFLQIKLLDELSEEEVARCFRIYLRTTFRIPVRAKGSWGDIIQGLFLDLYKNWHWPEDWRAWRKRIKRGIEGAVRSLNERRENDSDEFEDGLAHGRGIGGVPPRSSWWPLRSVEEAAQEHGVSASYIYRMIREGVIKPEKSKQGCVLIADPELGRLKMRQSAKELRRGLVGRLVQRGWSAEAARKYLYRSLKRGLTLAKITGMLPGPKPRKSASSTR